MTARLFALAALVALTACGGGHTNATTQQQTTTRTDTSGSMSHNRSTNGSAVGAGAYGSRSGGYGDRSGGTQRRGQRGMAAGNQPQEFDTEAAAARRCGVDVVWLNIKTGVYHAKGTEFYGNTKNGAYVCRKDADAAGDRAAKAN